MTHYQPIKVLFICHEGALYGAQQSLKLLIQGLLRQQTNRPLSLHVSFARPGPLIANLEALGIPCYQHQRLAWFKHQPRTLWQRLVDSVTLLLNLPSRLLPLFWQLRSYDLIHTNSLVSLEGALAAKLAGRPHIWHIREWLTPDNPRLFPVLGFNLTRFFVEHLSCRVLGISSAVLSGLHLENNPKAQLVPNAYPSSVTTQNKGSQITFRIGYVGRFSMGKRVDDLLKAFDLLCESLTPDAPIELCLVGQAEQEEDIRWFETAWTNFQNQHKAQRFGFQSEVTAIYQTLDVLVLPSENEAFGRVLLEAMAHGVLCVGANAGGIPDLLTDVGWLYPVGQVVPLASCLSMLYQAWRRHDPFLAEHRQRGLIQVQTNYTLEQQVHKVWRVYQESLQSNRI